MQVNAGLGYSAQPATAAFFTSPIPMNHNERSNSYVTP